MSDGNVCVCTRICIIFHQNSRKNATINFSRWWILILKIYMCVSVKRKKKDDKKIVLNVKFCFIVSNRSIAVTFALFCFDIVAPFFVSKVNPKFYTPSILLGFLTHANSLPISQWYVRIDLHSGTYELITTHFFESKVDTFRILPLFFLQKKCVAFFRSELGLYCFNCIQWLS